jgi:hypothetical protein
MRKKKMRKNRSIRRKPRDKEESECFYLLMKAKLDDNIRKGKVKWISNREMERTITITRNNMKIEIDIKELVQKIDMNKLIEEKIISDISNTIDIENMVDDALGDKEIRDQLNKKIIGVIENYIDSEEGKNRVIEEFNDAVNNLDLLDNDSILDIIAEFLKRKLAE